MKIMKVLLKRILNWDQRTEAEKTQFRFFYNRLRALAAYPRIARGRNFQPVEWRGFCPICRCETTFRAEQEWFRDHLLCLSCENGSIPRERALMLAIDNLAPEWRILRIHESSPCPRGVSQMLRRDCRGYVATQFFPDISLGTEHAGFRCEDLERQTFPDESFDLVVTQDVMEHVFEPEAVYREIWRTLRPGGLYLHTTPIYKERVKSARRAIRLGDGSIRYLAKPEYHGNPTDAQGSLVTWHYGYDLPDLIARWTPFDVEVGRFNDRRHGIVAEFTEVIICKKRYPTGAGLGHT
jgi:SAM-dependent methyltransferase